MIAEEGNRQHISRAREQGLSRLTGRQFYGGADEKPRIVIPKSP
jgi:hypothetical protein